MKSWLYPSKKAFFLCENGERARYLLCAREALPAQPE